MAILFRKHPETGEIIQCNCDKSQIPALEAAGWLQENNSENIKPNEFESEDNDDNDDNDDEE